jgi:hypothetical protein
MGLLKLSYYTSIFTVIKICSEISGKQGEKPLTQGECFHRYTVKARDIF